MTDFAFKSRPQMLDQPSLTLSLEDPSVEKRFDPDDKKVYSFKRIQAKYKGHFSDAEIQDLHTGICTDRNTMVCSLLCADLSVHTLRLAQ